jgi:hypothetical protein
LLSLPTAISKHFYIFLQHLLFLSMATGIAGQPSAETVYRRTNMQYKNAGWCAMACFTLKKEYKSRKTALLLHLIIIVLLPNF